MVPCSPSRPRTTFRRQNKPFTASASCRTSKSVCRATPSAVSPRLASARSTGSTTAAKYSPPIWSWRARWNCWPNLVAFARMSPKRVTDLLRDVRGGRQTVERAVRQLKSLAIHDLDFARVDGHRSLRKGFPEVIYCEGKTPAQVVKIAKKILQHNDNLLATRASKVTYRAVKSAFPKARYHEAARAITEIHTPVPKRTGINTVV